MGGSISSMWRTHTSLDIIEYIILKLRRAAQITALTWRTSNTGVFRGGLKSDTPLLCRTYLTIPIMISWKKCSIRLVYTCWFPLSLSAYQYYLHWEDLPPTWWKLSKGPTAPPPVHPRISNLCDRSGYLCACVFFTLNWYCKSSTTNVRVPRPPRETRCVKANYKTAITLCKYSRVVWPHAMPTTMDTRAKHTQASTPGCLQGKKKTTVRQKRRKNDMNWKEKRETGTRGWEESFDILW